MKHKLLILGLLTFFLTACGSAGGYSSEIKDIQAFENSYWDFDGDLMLVRTDENFEQVKNASDVILKLNHRFQKEYQMDPKDEFYLPVPQLVYEKMEGDTLYVKLENAEYVTQRMGSTGAGAFMALCTFTLTEIEGVKQVYFDFEEGDHARPGKYSRTDESFKDFLKTN